MRPCRTLLIPFFALIALVIVAGCGSSGSSDTAAESTTLDAVTGLKAEAGNGQIVISWNPVPGATSYNLYWETAATSSLTAGLAGECSGHRIEGITGTSYTHTGLVNGLTYTYGVTAVGVDDAESACSGGSEGEEEEGTGAVSAKPSANAGASGDAEDGPVSGCNHPDAANYDPTATVYVPGSCVWATDGLCGTANKSYAVGNTTFGADTFCSAGGATPASPTFPAQGSTTTWSCSGLNGGATVSCAATRGADTTPPTTTVAFSQVGKSGVSWTGSATIAEAGKGYCVALANGSGAPTAAEVHGAPNPAGFVARGTVAMTANVSANCKITGLTGGTTYDFYFLAEDSAENRQAAPSAAITAVASWTLRASGSASHLRDVAWSGARYIIVGDGATGLTSTDGITWGATGVMNNSNLTIGWSGSQFVAAGSNMTIETAPAAGTPWADRSPGGGNTFLGVGFMGSTSVVAGLGPQLYSSSDGVTWNVRVSGTANGLDGVAASNALFVVVGAAGTIITSPDGTTWTTRASGTANNLVDTIWTGSQFVAVGDAGTILTSPDGTNWTTRASGTAQTLYGVGWTGTELVAVGNAGTVITSPDGINWSADTLGAATALREVSADGPRIVAVGLNGTIYTAVR